MIGDREDLYRKIWNVLQEIFSISKSNISAWKRGEGRFKNSDEVIKYLKTNNIEKIDFHLNLEFSLLSSDVNNEKDEVGQIESIIEKYQALQKSTIWSKNNKADFC